MDWNHNYIPPGLPQQDYVVPDGFIPQNFPLEYYCMDLLGDPVPSDNERYWELNYPHFPIEFYLMLIVNETPPSDLNLLPKRPYGYYLAEWAGVPYDEFAPEEFYWTQIVGDNNLDPLPNYILEYYWYKAAELGLSDPHFRIVATTGGLHVTSDTGQEMYFYIDANTGGLVASDPYSADTYIDIYTPPVGANAHGNIWRTVP